MNLFIDVLLFGVLLATIVWRSQTVFYTLTRPSIKKQSGYSRLLLSSDRRPRQNGGLIFTTADDVESEFNLYIIVV